MVYQFIEKFRVLNKKIFDLFAFLDFELSEDEFKDHEIFYSSTKWILKRRV